MEANRIMIPTPHTLISRDTGGLQAIVTRYLPPTNYRPARIVVQCYAKRMVVEWDDGAGPDANHCRAAGILILALGWHERKWTYGSLPGNGFAFVMERLCK